MDGQNFLPQGDKAKMSLRPTRAAASKGREGIRASAQTVQQWKREEKERLAALFDDVSEEEDDEEEDGERENDEPLSQKSADLLPSSPIRRRDDDVSDPILLIMHVTTCYKLLPPKNILNQL